MRKLVVVVILLAVVLVVLDRVAVAGAERELSRQIAARYNLAAQPTITIEGIPFLTQAVFGRYEEIRLHVEQITQRGVRLSDVNTTLYGVHAPLGDLIANPVNAEITAERIVGSVVISWETIGRLAPRGVRLEGEGEVITASFEVTLGGRKVPIRAEMKLDIGDDALRLSPERVTAEGGLRVPGNIARSLSFTIPLRNLPFGLKLTEARGVADGFRVTGEATDVPLKG